MFGKFLTDGVIKKSMSLWIIVILLLSNIVIAPVSATTVAAQIFSKSFDGVKVRCVEVNSMGTMTFAGLDNGSIIAMRSNGSIVYNVLTADNIKKIISSNEGDITWLNEHGDVGYIFRDGTQNVTWIHAGASNVSDIAMAHNGSYFAKIWNGTTLTKMRQYDLVGGTPYAYDSGTGLVGNAFEHDDQNSLYIMSNYTCSTLFMFNITNYTGWIQFNPTKASKNTTLQTLDGFAYRANITINNGATVTTSMGFVATTDPICPYINRTPNGLYYYNITNTGKYFMWAPANNVSISPQSLYLNHSLYNDTTKVYNVTFNKSSLIRNMTMYFGGSGASTYTNRIVDNNWSINNGQVYYQNFTGTGTFTVPNNVTVVNISMYSGGGGGANYGTWPQYAHGGNASPLTSFGGIKVTPGASYTVTVGTGGYWQTAYVYVASTNSSFNNGTEFSAPTGGRGPDGSSSATGAGGSGNTSTTGYPTAASGSGAKHNNGFGVCIDSTNGAGGVGFGAGGGGAGGSDALCSGSGRGGAGANGFVQVSYYVNNISKYLVGADPQNGTSIFLAPTDPLTANGMNVTISSALIEVTNKSYNGNITSISIPSGGGYVVAGSGTPSGTGGKVYAIEITKTGFSTDYSANAQSGVSNDIASANGATYYIEARSSEVDIYEQDGTLAGEYNTGGTVNSVDIAVSNGLWATSGGNDGIVYIFSKATSSSWAVYFQGDAASAIQSVAMSDLGTYVAAGRSDGTFEFYSTQEDSTSDYIFSANLFVNKGGVPYTGQTISIGELSGTAPFALIDNKTGVTDSSGKFTFNAYNGRMYDIYINNEYHQIYTGSSTYPTIAVNIPVAVITRPYQYASTFNTTNKLVTSTYTDVNAADVNIKVIDVQSKAIISSRDYVGVTTVTDIVAVPYDNRSYKTVFNFTRTTGAQYSDTVYLQSSIFNRILNNTSDQYTLFIYAVYTVMLMTISLGVGMASTKYGVVFLVALTFAGILFGFLPYSLYTVGIATSAFIALLEVYRRHD